MQRIIQINIAGRLIPIEEDAYLILKDYLAALERQFVQEEGRDEIIADIENRIAELFGIRLQGGAPAIDREDVRKVIDTLGPAHDIGTGAINTYVPTHYIGNKQQNYYSGRASKNRRLYRNPYDKWLGGVCGGLADYFDIDPVIIRSVVAVSFFVFGSGLIAYIVAWAIIPIAKSSSDLNSMHDGDPMNFHDIAKNMQQELHELKKRGEQMSRDLKDFFSKKK